LVELHSRVLRVHLQVKGHGLYNLLLLASESGKAIGESIGYEELHGPPIYNAQFALLISFFFINNLI
ncbi:MAG: hypothetical protein IMZ43_03525, partial [Thermoplasmata archaeon]|nr:hypothetical protein [Thermoplasmata archaeon]